MGSQSLVLLCSLSLTSFSPLLLLAQQPYAGRETIKCFSTDNSTSITGYSCNGQNKSCQSYLLFRSTPLYNSVASISQLFTSDPYQLSQINSVSKNATFQTNKEVIVPVNCSCSGPYYQANTSYVVKYGDTRYGIAAEIYQGLVSCSVVRAQTCCSIYIYTGMNFTIPVRCACPTTNQTKHTSCEVFTYLFSNIRFGSDVLSTFDANGLSENYKIYQSSTLLIPLLKQPSGSQTIITPTQPPTPSSLPLGKSSKKTWLQMIIGVAAGGSVLIVSICLLCLLARRKKRISPTVIAEKQNKSNEPALPQELLAGISDPEHMLKIYEFEELQSATKIFGSKCRIDGSVYRGVINGDEVAIKQTNGDAMKEINLLKTTNHFNIIRLLGVCFSRGHWYLVYKYARNGSLSDWIFQRNGSEVLSWMQRVQISLDVAHGLDYLHNYTIPTHVHNNVKGSNILLDANFRAKIANFSLARSVERLGDGCVLTRHITGTQGLMAPEYLENGLISPKLDVCAFGIVMLEIITGKEAVVAGGGAMKLSEALIAFLDEENECGKLSKFMDPTLQGNYPLNLFVTMAKIIQGCLQKDAASRPSMSEIKESLLRILSNSSAWELSSCVYKDNLDPSQRHKQADDSSTSYILPVLSHTEALKSKDGSSRNRNEKMEEDHANAPTLIEEHKHIAQFSIQSIHLGSNDSSPVLSSSQMTPKISPKMTVHRGEPAVYFDESVIRTNAENFKYCLVGVFPASWPKLAEIREWAIREWKLEGDWSISLFHLHHVFIRLNCESDMLSILMKDSWVINGHAMNVMKWTPDYRPTGGESSLATVWIALPFLPLVFFQEGSLSSIASFIGRVIAIDEPTGTLPQIDTARICVEVDLLKDLPSRVWVGLGESGFWQEILYEDLPSYCTSCNRCGHNGNICKLNSSGAEMSDSQEKVTRSNMENLNA